jgi:chromosome segregation ATPase
VSKNYEPTYEGQLDKCQDERHSLQMQLEEYIEAFEFERKEFHEALDDLAKMKAERDEARRYSCDLEARITMLEEDRRDTSNNFGTNPCSEIILPDYPLARDPKEIAKRKGWDCYKEETK